MAETILISAVALWTNGRVTAFENNNTIAIDAEKISAFTPRLAYIKRFYVPGTKNVNSLLTFDADSATINDANTLVGVYIEQDGKGVVVDCVSIADFIAVANGSGNPLTTKYTGHGGVPLFTTPTSTSYCLVRTDNGDLAAHGQVVSDYVGQYFGNVVMRVHQSGVSRYELKSNTAIQPHKNDTITSGACS